MKKIYTFIFASAFVLLSMNMEAITIPVDIGPSGTIAFSPNPIPNVMVGDVIKWTLKSGSHSTTSQIVPVGAAPWDSGVLNTVGATYSYTVTVPGNYGYWCSVHTTSMVGGFTVSATAIFEPATNLLTSAYPNPFSDKVTLKYAGIQSVEVFNVIGEKVKSMELSAAEVKVDMDFTGFPAGVYFYRTYKEGTIVETKKIVKAN